MLINVHHAHDVQMPRAYGWHPTCHAECCSASELLPVLLKDPTFVMANVATASHTYSSPIGAALGWCLNSIQIQMLECPIRARVHKHLHGPRTPYIPRCPCTWGFAGQGSALDHKVVEMHGMRPIQDATAAAAVGRRPSSQPCDPI